MTRDTTTREWAESRPPGRPAPSAGAIEEIRVAHAPGPNGWCLEDVQDWPCEVADLFVYTDALAARLADAEAALWKYGRHDMECLGGALSCTCGLVEALGG